MFSVGLDVDTFVSKVMVTLLISIGLYAGNFDYFLGPLSCINYINYIIYINNTVRKNPIENEQSAGNSDIYDEINNLILVDDHISDHVIKHTKPKTDEALGYYLKKRIGYGSVLSLKNKHSVKYVLRHSEGLKKVLDLVNGKFLTDKKINQILTHKYDSKFNLILLPPAKFDLNSNH